MCVNLFSRMMNKFLVNLFGKKIGYGHHGVDLLLVRHSGSIEACGASSLGSNPSGGPILFIFQFIFSTFHLRKEKEKIGNSRQRPF